MLRNTLLSVTVLGFALAGGCASTMGEQLTKSISALQEVQASEHGVDPALLAKSKGIAILNEAQWALALGGVSGSGVMVRRLPDGTWSAPCAISSSALSVGLGIGGESRSVVLLFDRNETIDQIVGDGNFLVAQAQSTFGGSHAYTKEPAQSKDDVHAFVVAEGLFVNAALGNLRISVDEKLNHTAYGAEVTAWDILDGHAKPPAEWRALMERIDRIAKGSSPSVAQKLSSTPPTPANATVVETSVETAEYDEPAATSRKPAVER